MLKVVSKFAMLLMLVVTAACSTGQPPSGAGAMGADPAVDQDTQTALASLYESAPKARELAGQAKGILVFPRILKAGFIAGAEHGKGELIEGGKVTGYYATTAVTYGLQAGVQKFGYAMMFMTDSALNELKTSPGFEVGIGPSIVVVDQGAARTLTTTTMQSDIYAFVFDQKGLMAGIGLRGSKITKLNR